MTTQHGAVSTSGRTLSILDTSVLYVYLRGRARFGDSDPNARPADCLLQQAIEALFRHRDVIIPHVVLIEMVGQFFHTAIDLTNYPMWYRTRNAVFQPTVLNLLFSSGSRLRLFSECPRVCALNRACDAISPAILAKLRQRYARRPPRGPREPKYLDGMDAQILDEALCIAERHPDARCELISSDSHLELAVDEIRQQAGSNEQIPGNLHFRYTNGLIGLARRKGWIRS